jgi:DNA-binding MarR family transcriptional regulator
MSDPRNFNPEERAKLKQLISESSTTMNEIEILQGGLKDTIKHIAEELEIKPSVLTRAIKIAQKRDMDRVRDDVGMIESILRATGNDQDGAE